MTKQPPTSRKLVRQTVGPVDKRRRKRGLTVAVRTAIDAMVFDRCTRAEACQRAGLQERSLYLAFEKPEVAAYFNKQLEVLRAGERPQNIHRLTQIRDACNNMPAVQAVRLLEQLDQDAISRPSANRPTPGVVINVVSASPSPPVIDVMPFAPPAQPAQLEPPPPAIDADPIFRVP
jgi:hypothetical protein